MDTLVRGTGRPVTVFAHGFGGGIPDTRPLASGVPGTRVFYTAAAHDGEPVPGFGYPLLASELRTVADRHHARQALGVSMGAGALCRLLAQTPDRFDAVVFFLPPVLDSPRPRPGTVAGLDAAIRTGDSEAITAAVVAELPGGIAGTPAGRAYTAARPARLRQPAVRDAGAALVGGVAVTDADLLRAVTARALVLGCRNDPAHPAEVAERLAGLLPDARLHLYDEPGVVWTHRTDLRHRISRFLSG